MNKSKIFLVLFLTTVLMVGPFIIINSAKKEEKNSSVNNLENEIVNTINVQENNNNEELSENTDVKKVDNENIEKEKENNKNNNKENENVKENNKENVSKNYFGDALFIGDSRTVGIMEYGNLNNATFFANNGLSVYNVREKVVSSPKIGKLTLDELLTNKKFDKIYIMLGINELGYDHNQSIKKYSDLVQYIIKKQPNAIIYIEANLHVTEKKSSSDKIFNNKNIDLFNNSIKKLADNKKIFYIDINEKFNDGKGNLAAEYTSDQVHIYAKYYKEWSDWIIKKSKGEV